MTTEQLKQYLDQAPFRPFQIVTADGYSIPVAHEDYVSVGPRGRTVLVWDQDDNFRIVDVPLIIRLDFLKEPPQPQSGQEH